MRVTIATDDQFRTLRIQRDGYGRKAWTVYEMRGSFREPEWYAIAFYETRSEAMADQRVETAYTTTITAD